jgi:acetyl esterase/lipase
MADTAPAFDPQLVQVLVPLQELYSPTLEPSGIVALREQMPPTTPEALIAGRRITHTETTIPGPDGAPAIVVSVFAPTDHVAGGPGIVNIHGGGMVVGDRFTSFTYVLDWVLEFGAVVVTADYRLAPEHPDPAPVEDSYTTLVWAADHAAELGFDPAKLIVAGASAGGGLAAGVALLARDRSGPALLGQVLMYPMLDDRNETVSSHQYRGVGVWDRTSNATGWGALLGDRVGTNDVSPYAAPARATDFSGLPPTFIEVGSAEVFRDEDVAYATAIWAAGGQAELHVWAGGFHGYEHYAPDSSLTQMSVRTRTDWLHRLLEN